jgi:endonuclease/exonuclease/phosphatase family metal-dependent hydrolase
MKYPKTFWTITLAVFFSTGNVCAQEKTEDILRILCYNVHHCNPPSKEDVIDVAAIAGVIKNTAPDLVALQEIDVHTARSGKDVHQARQLAQLTGMYPFFVKTIDFQGGEYGIAILSRYPILDAMAFELPMNYRTEGEPRGVAAILIEPVEGNQLAFVCTHLDVDDDNKEMQINAITDYMQGIDFPVIIAGDFNSEPDSYVVRELDKVFQRTCTDCPFTIPEINPQTTIDYIAFSPKTAFSVIEHKVIEEPYASDHLPVFAKIKFMNLQ